MSEGRTSKQFKLGDIVHVTNDSMWWSARMEFGAYLSDSALVVSADKRLCYVPSNFWHLVHDEERRPMSDGGTFFAVLLGLVALTLFLGWLYAKWQVGTANRNEKPPPSRVRAAVRPRTVHGTSPPTGHPTGFHAQRAEVRRQAGR